MCVCNTYLSFFCSILYRKIKVIIIVWHSTVVGGEALSDIYR